jgi:hypothetical protein
MGIGDKVLVFVNAVELVGKISDIKNEKYVVNLEDGSSVIVSKDYLRKYNT